MLIRDGVGAVFGGETLLGILGGIASIIAIISVPVWLYEKLFARRQVTRSRPPAPNSRSQGDGEIRALQTKIRSVARQVRAFVQERDEDDPFHREEIPRNSDSPEYKDLAARYDAHVEVTRGLYRKNHLPDVARVRDALADRGMTDPELDRLYESPRNYNEMRTLADRLVAMADSLSR
jgi:hypothetical protein